MGEKKRVPLYIGEGPDRVRIGEADVETLDSTGIMFVKVYLADESELGRHFGFAGPRKIKGIVPPALKSKEGN